MTLDPMHGIRKRRYLFLSNQRYYVFLCIYGISVQQHWIKTVYRSEKTVYNNFIFARKMQKKKISISCNFSLFILVSDDFSLQKLFFPWSVIVHTQKKGKTCISNQLFNIFFKIWIQQRHPKWAYDESWFTMMLTYAQISIEN